MRVLRSVESLQVLAEGFIRFANIERDRDTGVFPGLEIGPSIDRAAIGNQPSFYDAAWSAQDNRVMMKGGVDIPKRRKQRSSSGRRLRWGRRVPIKGVVGSLPVS